MLPVLAAHKRAKQKVKRINRAKEVRARVKVKAKGIMVKEIKAKGIRVKEIKAKEAKTKTVQVTRLVMDPARPHLESAIWLL